MSKESRPSLLNEDFSVRIHTATLCSSNLLIVFNNVSRLVAVSDLESRTTLQHSRIKNRRWQGSLRSPIIVHERTKPRPLVQGVLCTAYTASASAEGAKVTGNSRYTASGGAEVE